MNFLLDTHIWLWMHLAPEKLTPNVLAILKDLNNQLWLSPISVWELSVLVDKRHIALAQSVNLWVSISIKTSDLHEAPFTISVAERLEQTLQMHRDPADRLLVATALAYDLTLITADHQLCQPIQGLNVLNSR